MGAFLKSFVFAWKGIIHSLKVGRNFKVQLCIGALAIVLGIAFRVDSSEWALLWICIGVVLGGECMNTAMEALADLVSPDYNELAGKAKDCAAGAVLVCSIASAIVACFVFLPKIFGVLTA